MELKQLRIFLAVADGLHFGRAAEAMNMAQPALSAQIKNLEERLGVKLFERTTRSVSLTRAGETFLPEAKATLAQADAAVTAARSVRDDGMGLLKVGGVDSATVGLLPEVVRRFRSRYPQTEIKIFEMLSAPAIHALANRSLDVAFVRIPPKESYLESRAVFSEPIVVALPGDSPFAKESSVSLHDIAGQPLVIPARSHRPILFDVIHKHFRDNGIEPHILQEANERHMIIAMVAAGLGVSLVPEWVSQFKRDDVVYLPLSEPCPLVDVHVAWRSGEGMKPALDFLECVPDHPD
ncbi:LysR substrate-binding domain-containing protein [Litoreibacter roseus]|uniref:LysR family transcriptional regulator n=1 Tax=Litoreibacter roseus TaxID=2601869 RepID=A0A6N6JKC2_9RHOB|nr:LysR substrate-binding domain-containing protein [Litoreibacter roseus]GFE66773.1 LysR family transcriptional regulator [Litoreibacter roseus]